MAQRWTAVSTAECRLVAVATGSATDRQHVVQHRMKHEREKQPDVSLCSLRKRRRYLNNRASRERHNGRVLALSSADVLHVCHQSPAVSVIASADHTSEV